MELSHYLFYSNHHYLAHFWGKFIVHLNFWAFKNSFRILFRIKDGPHLIIEQVLRSMDLIHFFNLIFHVAINQIKILEFCNFKKSLYNFFIPLLLDQFEDLINPQVLFINFLN